MYAAAHYGRWPRNGVPTDLKPRNPDAAPTTHPINRMMHEQYVPHRQPLATPLPPAYPQSRRSHTPPCPRRMGDRALWISLLLTSCVLGAGAPQPKPPHPPAAAAEGSPANPSPNRVGPSKVRLSDNAPPGAVARVNKQWILLHEVDALITEDIAAIQDALKNARVRELHLRVNAHLLEQEARRRGITTVQLLERDVRNRATDPDGQTIRRYYDDHAAELGSDFDAVRDRIRKKLHGESEAALATELAERLRKAADITIVDDATVRDALPEDPHTVLARVDQYVITVDDLTRAMRPIDFNARHRIYELRLSAIDTLINTHLIRAEAKRQTVSAQDLLSREIQGRTKTITEMDARVFYDRNRDTIQADVRTPKGLQTILHYLEQRQRRQAQSDYAAALRRRAAIRVFLPVPESPVYDIDTTDRPSLGPPDAPITIVAFIDFQCSSCAWLHGHFRELLETYGQKLRIVARDYPIERHANAYRAAIAAEAAAEQGMYWEYSSILMNNQSALDDDRLLEYAAYLNVDMDRFRKALADGRLAEKVETDRRAAMRLGADATPAVFLNGRRVPIEDALSLRHAIEQALPDRE